MESLGKNIKILRVINGWSQTILARKMGVSRTTIVDWENCDTVPNLGATIALAALAGVSLDTFAQGSLVKDEAFETSAQRR